ncbi:unnamed protein product [Merluccius merluccius]
MAAGSTTLIVEGLPADLDDRIVKRLSLYFSNKRRSGGEVSQVLADPSNRRRALLVYDVDDGVRSKVLLRETHQVDLKGNLGVVTLHVRMPPEDVNAQSLGLLRHGPSWETNARREVQTHLEKYMVEHIPMEPEVWQAIKGSCPEVNVATALISFKNCTSELVVVGIQEKVKTLVKEIKSKMEKAIDELQNTVEKDIQLNSKERSHLGPIYTLHLKEFSKRVQRAETLIQKQNKKIVTRDVPLKSVQQVEFVEACMKLSVDPQLRALGTTILPCRSPQSPCLKVTAISGQIEKAIDVVNMHISRGGLEIKECVVALLEGIKDHLSKHNFSVLKQIFLVVDHVELMQECQQSLLYWTQLTQSSLCLASVCRDVSFPKVEVEVHGCCSSDVAKVKELVDDLVTNECKLYSICSPYMRNLLDSEIQAIATLSKSLQVCVSVSGPDKATASGKVEDALTIVREIEKYLQTAKEWTIRQEEENRLRETVCWEVSDGETWAELSVCVSLDLERAMYEKKASISYTQNKQTYTVNLKSMEQRDGKGTITRIKRTLKADSENAVIEPPPNWDRMGNKTLDVVDLSPTSKQYKVVAEHFLKTSKDPQNATSITFTVVKMLDKKYPKNKNEIDLYHGSTVEICQKVNNYGFNRSFCGRNAIAYGKGTYFAKQSWYSCNDQYSSPDAQGVKYMYQARVLVGKPCLGVTNMVEPTPLDPSNPLAGLHDCAVNNIQNPFIYVVFSDAGAYPEYLISFKKA